MGNASGAGARARPHPVRALDWQLPRLAIETPDLSRRSFRCMSEPHPTIRPQPGILDIALYQGGEARLAGHAQRAEAQLEREPVRPVAEGGRGLPRGAGEPAPLPEHRPRRAARRDRRGARPRPRRASSAASGSDEIIAFLTQAYAGPGTEVIHTEHGFGMYRISALAAGATPVEVRERERRTDVDAILAACDRADRAGLHRQPQQPDRHDDRRAPRSRASPPACRRRRSWCSTAPMPSSSAASTATPAWSRPATTW